MHLENIKFCLVSNLIISLYFIFCKSNAGKIIKVLRYGDLMQFKWAMDDLFVISVAAKYFKWSCNFAKKWNKNFTHQQTIFSP